MNILMFKFKHLNKLVLLFIIASLILFVGIILLIGEKQKWFAEKSEYYTFIKDSANIDAGVPIKIAGFDIGFVKNLKLSKIDNKLTVRVIFYIFDEYSEYVTVEAHLNLYKPIVGMPFFELSSTGGKIIKEEDMIFIPTLRENEVMLNTLNLVGSLKDELTPLLQNVKHISEEILVVTKQINDPNGNIQKIIGHSELLLANVNHGGGVIGKMLTDPKFAGTVDNMTNQLQNIMDKINVTIIELNKIAMQLPEYSKDLHSLINVSNDLLKNVNTILSSQNIEKYNAMADTLDKLSSNMNVLTQNLNEITGRLRRGEGTIGKMITYDTIYNEVETMVSDLKSTVKISNDWVKKIDNISLKPGFETTHNFKESFQQYKLFLNFGDPQTKYFKISAGLKSGIDFNNNAEIFRDKNLTKNEFDKFKLSVDAVYGIQLFNLPISVYGGVIESNIGVGINVDALNNLSIDGNIRKTKENEKFDKPLNSMLKVNYMLYKNIHIFSGINSLFNKNEFIAGIKY